MARKVKAAELEKVLTIIGASTPARDTVLTSALAKTKKEVDYGDDAGSEGEAITNDTLDALRRLAQEVVDGERDVEVKTETLKKAAEALATVQEDRLPKLMQQHGMERFDFVDTTTGLKQTIKLDDKLRVAMPTMKVGNRFVADVNAARPIYAWLREIGQGGSVKKTVDIPAGLVADERIAMLMDHIKNFDNTLEPGLTEKIEPATLTALVSRMREAGQNVHEAIKITPVLKAKVSAK